MFLQIRVNIVEPNGMTILLPQVLPIANPEQFKLHLACWNGSDQPLDVFVRDREEWDGWNKWRGMRDDFSHPILLGRGQRHLKVGQIHSSTPSAA